MRTSLKTKIFFVMLLISLALAQGYAVHASQAIYEARLSKTLGTDFFMSEYLKHYP